MTTTVQNASVNFANARRSCNAPVSTTEETGGLLSQFFLDTARHLTLTEVEIVGKHEQQLIYYRARPRRVRTSRVRAFNCFEIQIPRFEPGAVRAYENDTGWHVGICAENFARCHCNYCFRPVFFLLFTCLVLV